MVCHGNTLVGASPHVVFTFLLAGPPMTRTWRRGEQATTGGVFNGAVAGAVAAGG